MPEIPPTPPSGIVGDGASGLDPSRVAVIIETRPDNTLPALISHFIAVLPPAWVVKMVGTKESFSVIHKSRSLKQHITSQKLQLQELPPYWSVNSSESISQTLTNATFYADFLAPAEWVLMFQTDSIICSASDQSIDDWVAKNYSWVGAPWNLDVHGGNGGLSLRHIPSIVELLKNESRPVGHRQWEDIWICDRIANAAPPKEEVFFSVESIYVERPFGYHLRGSGRLLDGKIWGNKTRKRQILEYCPEAKIVLGNMSLQPANDAEMLKKELEADAEKARQDAGGVPRAHEQAVATDAAPKPTVQSATTQAAVKFVSAASNVAATANPKAKETTETPVKPGSAAS